MCRAAAAGGGFRCHICGESFDPTDPFQVDHVVALANGGTNDADNRRLAHRSCNLWKGAK